jgi:hypothetical protein
MVQAGPSKINVESAAAATDEASCNCFILASTRLFAEFTVSGKCKRFFSRDCGIRMIRELTERAQNDIELRLVSNPLYLVLSLVIAGFAAIVAVVLAVLGKPHGIVRLAQGAVLRAGAA